MIKGLILSLFFRAHVQIDEKVVVYEVTKDNEIKIKEEQLEDESSEVHLHDVKYVSGSSGNIQSNHHFY